MANVAMAKFWLWRSETLGYEHAVYPERGYHEVLDIAK